MNAYKPNYAGIATMIAVVNDEGRAVAVCDDPIEATAFCHCLGFDAPLDHMEVVPVVSFAKSCDGR